MVLTKVAQPFARTQDSPTSISAAGDIDVSKVTARCIPTFCKTYPEFLQDYSRLYTRCIPTFGDSNGGKLIEHRDKTSRETGANSEYCYFKDS